MSGSTQNVNSNRVASSSTHQTGGNLFTAAVTAGAGAVGSKIVWGGSAVKNGGISLALMPFYILRKFYRTVSLTFTQALWGKKLIGEQMVTVPVKRWLGTYNEPRSVSDLIKEGVITSLEDFKKFSELRGYSKEAAILKGILPVEITKTSWLFKPKKEFRAIMHAITLDAKKPRYMSMETAINNNILTAEQAGKAKWANPEVKK